MSFNIGKYIPKFNFDFLKNITPDQIMSLALNLLLVAIVITSIIALLGVINQKYKHDKLFGLRSDNVRKEGYLENNKLLNPYYKNLKKLLLEKDMEGSLGILFYGTIVFLVGLGIYLITVKQILLAIIIPFAMLKSINKIVTMLATNVIEKIEEQLPFAIDNIIRIMSKYGDLRNIIYEASRSVDAPLKGVLEKVSRKMISSNPEAVLMELAEEFDNVWIYSMVFTLLSYIQDANKEDTIKNLKHLRNILEKENTLKKASVTDKRYGVVINYAIAFIAGLAGIGQIILNPIGKEFFFSSFTGIICFVLGYGAIIVTIMINITMSKAKATKK